MKPVKTTIVAAAAAVLALAAAGAAWAAVVSAQGFGYDRAGACQSAKNNAAVRVAGLGEDVQSYGVCSCSDNGSDTAQRWTCTIDAYY